MKDERDRHTLWITPGTWAMVESHYHGDNCSTKNEYIEKAVRFYTGYLDAKGADEYLPRILSDVLNSKLDALGGRIGRLLFKQGRKKLLRLVDAHTTTQEEMALNSFIAGFRLAWGIAMELGVDGKYSYEQEQEQINRLKNWGAVNKEGS